MTQGRARIASSASLQRAHQAITTFERTAKQGAFRHISPKSVAMGLRERINNPTKINQHKTYLCGPAAFMYVLAKDKPEVYVDYVIGLYETGRGQIGTQKSHLHVMGMKVDIGTFKVKPGSDCKNFKPGNKIPPVDWIALASLRDSSNAILDFDKADAGMAGMTFPADLKLWLYRAGFKSRIEKANHYFNKGIGTFRDADAKFRAGYRVFLLIDFQAMYPNRLYTHSHFPDHWVVMAAPFTVKDKSFSMKVYTWGGIRTVPDAGFTRMDRFFDNFYGYVAARP